MIDVVAGLIFRDRRVLMLQKQGFWLFPGGKVEEGESDLQALLRELREEVGFPWDRDAINKLAPGERPTIAFFSRHQGDGLPGVKVDCRFYLVLMPLQAQLKLKLNGEHRGGKHQFVGEAEYLEIRASATPFTLVSSLCLQQLIEPGFLLRSLAKKLV